MGQLTTENDSLEWALFMAGLLVHDDDQFAPEAMCVDNLPAPFPAA